MTDSVPTTALVIRLATPADIDQIEQLDRLSTSPTRNIHRDVEKYFGSVDPSTHERTLIFLAELDGAPVAKAELMLPPTEAPHPLGYIKRVIVKPEVRKKGVAHQLMEHVIAFARQEQQLEGIDLHVWEHNQPAIRLYEALGFELQHRELYYRLTL